MQLKPFSAATVALVAASATNAFLIPPELSEIDVEIADITPLPASSENVLLELDCSGCPVRIERQSGEVLQALSTPPNHLELSFGIEHAGQSDRLVVNGFELYPSANPFAPLFANQDLNANEKRDVYEEVVKILPQSLGYSLRVQPVANDAEGKMELIMVDLQIIEVGDVFIDNIPNVRVKLIKAPGSQLLIGGVETTASEASPANAGLEQEQCTTLTCKWTAYIKDKMSQMKNHIKPCHGKNKGMEHASPADGMMHHGHPGHGHGHHEHHGHHGQMGQHAGNHHSFGRLLKNIATHILFPILIGVIAGVSFSLLGMVVGTLIVSTWRAFFRRPSQRAAVKEDASTEEKSGLIEHQDPPPAYETEAEDPKTVV